LGRRESACRSNKGGKDSSLHHFYYWYYYIVYKEFVGDFRNGSFDLGWDTFDEETQIRKRGIELNQGRAAMMGILALMVHEQLGVSLLPEV